MIKKKKGKVGIDSFINWGATIVIVGLMFKLQHWEWGDWLIVIGLGAEAIIFLLLGYQAIGANDEDEVILQPVVGHTASLDGMLQHADISPDAINNLGLGLKTFSNTVSSISQVADASVATNDFTSKLKTASLGFDKFNIAFEKASADLESFGAAKIDTASYNEQISRLSKNLEALNSIYEVELKESSTTLNSMNKHYENIAKTLNSLNDSAAETKMFKDQVNQLNKNLASLNAVYGNMLAAMNQPHA
jgi:gliding motility-associated protein GldL